MSAATAALSGLSAPQVARVPAPTSRRLTSLRAPVSSSCTASRPALGKEGFGSALLHKPRNQSAFVSAASSDSGSDTTASGEVLEYILEGPLLESCGFSPEDVKANQDTWIDLGKRLAEQLEFPCFEDQDGVERLRIYHYYLPVFLHLDSQLAKHKAAGNKEALVVGISAPQGCGKTTVVEQLEQLFAYTGHRAASVSIDDFYLTFEEQCVVADANDGNRLLQLRGNAGSHDMQLGTETLCAVCGCTSSDTKVALPRYDKSAHAGRGTRADPSTWPSVEGPVDVVLFEGWMLGFAPVEDDAAAAVDEQLLPVNTALRAYEEAWDSFVDSWLVIKIQDPQCVFQWRLQAEVAMRDSGKPGMTDEQVADFVDRFMPAYQAYLPALYDKGPTTASPGNTLIIEVDARRSPVACQPAPVI